MNTRNVLATICAVVFISACSSNSPSESEIKKAAIGDIDGVCKLVKIENFIKVNGVAGNGGNSYQESVKYTLNVLPFPDAQNILKDFENKHTEATKTYDAAKANSDAVYAKFNGDTSIEANQSRNTAHDAREAAWQVMDQSSLSNTNHGIPYDQLVNQACPSSSPELNAFIASSYASSKEFFIGGANKEVNQTINMIKSDNGWVKGE
ncbi:MAG: hypothetical protein NTY60_09780 [Proteobacteria bacterium]|nr:hypothetical protein [Pseudomonadota bacterium]